MTNASKESDVKQHYVTVKFLDLVAIAITPIPLLTATKQVARGYLAFDCDCGRDTFGTGTYQPLAALMQDALRQDSQKYATPNLHGVACSTF